MLSTSHPELKTQIVNACLEIFPEAQGILLWGGSVTADFSPEVSDVDVIIEVPADFGQEVALAERLKTLMQTFRGLRLDPFVYLTAAKEEDLEFIAPFGFYKANPFIPYLIRTQHEIVYGASRLLDKLPELSLNEALVGMLPSTLGALKRLRMDAQVEESWTPLAIKHRASLFMIARSYFAFEQDGVGSKKEAVRFLAKRFPEYQSITDTMGRILEPPSAPATEPQELSLATILDFVKVMEEYFQTVKRRQSTH